MAELLHIVVRGHVQGVGYRYFTTQQARALGISGWVRNREDGTVELLARVPPAARRRFLAALRRGPPASAVDAVEVTPGDAAQAPQEPGFRVRR